MKAPGVPRNCRLSELKTFSCNCRFTRSVSGVVLKMLASRLLNDWPRSEFRPTPGNGFPSWSADEISLIAYDEGELGALRFVCIGRQLSTPSTNSLNSASQ